MRLEVCPQTVANHIAAKIINHPRKLFDLSLGQKLGLVDQKLFDHLSGLSIDILHKIVEIGVMIDPPAFSLDAYA